MRAVVASRSSGSTSCSGGTTEMTNSGERLPWQKKSVFEICFDFAHAWGRSRRCADDLRYLTPYLKPFTALPGESRYGGW